ncbi:MAG TPA: hypothetical protein VJP58_09665 [Candidatus Nitrosocosmicus sp.]|nr:hypothetical protein [Candidatus Nitrosocosmicus sp.]
MKLMSYDLCNNQERKGKSDDTANSISEFRFDPNGIELNYCITKNE